MPGGLGDTVRALAESPFCLKSLLTFHSQQRLQIFYGLSARSVPEGNPVPCRESRSRKIEVEASRGAAGAEQG